MSTATAAFPRIQNGYSPQHVDEFVAALAQRARTQIAALEQRVARLQTESAEGPAVELTDRIAELERRIAEKDAELSEERGRVAMLQRQLEELQPTPVEVVEFDLADDFDVAEITPPEPQNWASSVIGRSSYQEWTDEQRMKAAESLRRKRLSACSPAE